MKLDLKSIIALLLLAVLTVTTFAGVMLLVYASFKFVLPT